MGTGAVGRLSGYAIELHCSGAVCANTILRFVSFTQAVPLRFSIYGSRV